MANKLTNTNKAKLFRLLLDKKYLATTGFFGLLFGALTFSGLSILIYTATAYFISVIIIITILSTVLPRLIKLIGNKNSVKLSENEYTGAIKNITYFVISILTILNFYIPLRTETTNICTHNRRNIFTGPLTEADRPQYNINFVGGVCAESKYNIYLF